MDAIFSLLNEYRIIVGLVLTLMVTAIIISVWWDKVSFWWLNVWYAMPVIGKEASLAKDYETKSKIGAFDWLASEATLCEDFASHYDKVDKDEEMFNKSQDYLAKTTENGRNVLHFMGWLLIVALVFVEAMGFSYVLSGFTIPGASESLQQKGALGIAFIISVLLVGLTHFTGHELHANSLIAKVRTWWRNDKSKPLAPDTSITLETTFKDNNAEPYQKLLNRINTNASAKPRYVITTITAIAIIVIAILATYVRGQVLEKMHIDEVALTSTNTTAADPFSQALPTELVAEQKVAVDKAADDSWERERKGGWGTFIFLAFLFVFLQIFGILIGYKTGFAGKQSSEARKIIGNFNSEKEFKTFYSKAKQHVARVAQKRLTNLQKKMVSRAADHSNDNRVIEMLEKYSGDRTFLQFVDVRKREESDFHSKDQERANRMRQVAEPVQQPLAASVVSETVQQPKAAAVVAELQSEVESREEMEKRLRAELLAEMQQLQPAETEEQMRARLKAELMQGQS